MKIFVFVLLASCGLFAGPSHFKAWIDPPREVLGQAEIDGLIARYHEFPQDSAEHLPARIALLREIEQRLMAEQRSYFTHIAEIARNRAWYLSQLESIYQQQLDSEEAQRRYHETFDEEQPALVLVNRAQYDARLRSHWGLFWLETLDPAHRLFLTDPYLEWQRLGSSTRPPFFLWLETRSIPHYSPQIRWFDEAELDMARVQIQSEGLSDATGIAMNTSEGAPEQLYIINLARELLVTSWTPEVRHTSLSHGRPVLAAGSIRFRAGKIIHIDMESGHYQPTRQNAVNAIQLLRSLGAVFDEACTVGYYSEGETHLVNLQEF